MCIYTLGEWVKRTDKLVFDKQTNRGVTWYSEELDILGPKAKLTK